MIKRGRPRGKPKKIIKDIDIPETKTDISSEKIEEKSKSEKEILLELYENLKARNIRSIGDLENQIANCQ